MTGGAAEDYLFGLAVSRASVADATVAVAVTVAGVVEVAANLIEEEMGVGRRTPRDDPAPVVACEEFFLCFYIKLAGWVGCFGF